MALKLTSSNLFLCASACSLHWYSYSVQVHAPLQEILFCPEKYLSCILNDILSCAAALPYSVTKSWKGSSPGFFQFLRITCRPIMIAVCVQYSSVWGKAHCAKSPRIPARILQDMNQIWWYPYGILSEQQLKYISCSEHVKLRLWEHFYSCHVPEFISSRILYKIHLPYSDSNSNQRLKYLIRHGLLSYVEMIHYSYPVSRYYHYPYFKSQH